MIDINSNDDREGIINDLLPDLTPLLDVMFMLIVFLVLTANTVPTAFDVVLPEDNNKVAHSIENDDNISVTIFSQGKGWGLNARKFDDFEAFKKQLVVTYNNSQKKPGVVVYGDKRATVEKLLKLLTYLRSKGIETADIVME